jgi:hypothetical protein
MDLLKGVLLSAAFLWRAANQVFPAGWAPVANDTAIALVVLDLALILWSDLRGRVTRPS